ncbi:MAG: TIGR00296 family protein [Methanobacteriaceae archaeon]|nr:TIGR00296 family protein [Candidatus Methanorudis spinitermitis]
MLRKEDGNYLIRIAKKAINEYIINNTKIDVPKDCPEYLKEKLGVFVTLNESKNLRGCIGYPEPIEPLIKAVIDVSISAATADPRFPKLTEDELSKIEIEVTVLTKPKIIQVSDPNEYPKKIAIGEDGLIIEKGFNKGLLLPQVATEHGMDSEEFLSNTCMKAGLDYSCWLNSDVKISSFQGQIFKES